MGHNITSSLRIFKAMKSINIPHDDHSRNNHPDKFGGSTTIATNLEVFENTERSARRCADNP